MGDRLTLIGFEHSVYTWVVRLALAELGLDAAYVEANPFADPRDPVLAQHTPLGRVPVLQHGDFRLTETAAILRYLARVSGQGQWLPENPKAAARMDQVMGLVDADVYPILVRQVFSHGYYWPVVLGEAGQQEVLSEGIERCGPCLQILNGIAGEGLQLGHDARSLADLHIAPMLSYALRVPALAARLPDYPALADWWQAAALWPALRATDPLAGYALQE